MREGKRLKDPIYGYISIPQDLVSAVVDTAPFQRLRRVVQTSYAPLYPSALHNCFVHSLGVYHLATLVTAQVGNDMEKTCQELGMDWEAVRNTFELACLLHDVGHAPYSHTGEMLFCDSEKGYGRLHDLLSAEVGSESFERDLPSLRIKAAAPHEIVSAIVGLREYGSLLSETQREFFARCVTGYQYSPADAEGGNALRNCLISLLNSRLIDVDKLDYLIRDAYVTGFRTVNIDYERLISSVRIMRPQNGGTFRVVYSKGAVSVIENMVYAHDSERKWIQTHPAVLYESYLLQRVMRSLDARLSLDSDRLFSCESLSLEGSRLRGGLEIRLLCDDDIVFLAKNRFFDEAVQEYFERNRRRHPIWKSEAEYKACLLNLGAEGAPMRRVRESIKATAEYLAGATSDQVIDENLISHLERERARLDDGPGTADIPERTLQTQKRERDRILKVMRTLRDIARHCGIPCSFVILTASQFASGFGKPDFAALEIAFGSGDSEETIEKFQSVVSTAGHAESAESGDKFFYIFYRRVRPDRALSEKQVRQICWRLFTELGAAD